MNMFSKKNIVVFLTILVAIGLILRNLYIKDLAISWSYDQARDYFIVQEIINGDLKIQGPSANAPGMHHGVIYYYFLLIPYLIGNTDPVYAGVWLSVFNALTIILVYILSFSITKNKQSSLIAAFLFTISYEAVQYASWLSNPSIGVWFVPLIYLFLWHWTVSKKTIFAILTGLFLGFSVQANLFLFYHFIPILIWILINNKNFKLKQIFTALLGLVIGCLTLIISEFKFNFQSILGLKYLFGRENQIVESLSFFNFVSIYLNQLGDLFTLNLLPTQIVLSKFLGLIMIIWLILEFTKSKSKTRPNPNLLLLLYILSHSAIVWFGGLNTPYIAVGMGSAVCVLAGMFISSIYSRSKFVAISLIMYILWSNVYTIVIENKKGQTIFSTRQQMLLSNLVDVVNYTYESSARNKFSIDTVTAPLWLNTTWSSVYNLYGQPKYGYLPAWHGRDQVGYWGDNLDKDKDVKFHYLIIEPKAGIPDIYIQYAIDDENIKSKLIEEKYFDGITVQKREKIK